MANCFKFSSPVKSPMGDLGAKQQQNCTAPKSRIAELGVKPRSGLSSLGLCKITLLQDESSKRLLPTRAKKFFQIIHNPFICIADISFAGNVQKGEATIDQHESHRFSGIIYRVKSTGFFKCLLSFIRAYIVVPLLCNLKMIVPD